MKLKKKLEMLVQVFFIKPKRSDKSFIKKCKIEMLSKISIFQHLTIYSFVKDRKLQVGTKHFFTKKNNEIEKKTRNSSSSLFNQTHPIKVV